MSGNGNTNNRRINNKSAQMVLDILIMLCQVIERRENNNWNLPVMEILFHMLKGEDPEAVAEWSGPAQGNEGGGGDGGGPQQQQQQQQQKQPLRKSLLSNKNISASLSRHSR